MKQTLFYFMLFLLIACQPKLKTAESKAPKYQQIQKTAWFLGSWQQQSSNGVLTESWSQLDDSVFLGKSFFVDNRDTLSSESIRLEQHNEKLYYIPTVSGQNEGKAVVFTLTSLTDSTVTFENPGHDFPQKIEYWFQRPDSLIAEVSSVTREHKKSLVFRMKRVN